MFTDPVAQAIIRNPETNQEWRWTAPEWPFLTGVVLAYEMQRQASLQLSFDAPYQDAIDRILIANGPFQQGNNVRARIGYASRPDWWTPWFSGFLIAGGDGLSLDPNGLSGSITTQVISEAAHYQLSSKQVLSNPYQTPLEMLERCAQALGLKFYAHPDVAEDVLVSLYEAWRPEAYFSLTAWEAVKRICAYLNVQFWIGTEGGAGLGECNTLNVATERELSTGEAVQETPTGDESTPRTTFRMRGIIDLPTNTFPCLTWAPEGAGAAAWLATGNDQSGKGVEILILDTKTGEITEIDSDPNKRNVAIVGNVSTPGPEDQSVSEGSNENTGDQKPQDGKPPVRAGAPIPESNDTAKRAQREADRRVAAGSPAQEGVIASIGLPWIQCGGLVNLAGCGDIYDGPYLVQKVTHTWAPGTYDMSLTVRRQGTGGGGKTGEKVDSPAGQMPEG